MQRFELAAFSVIDTAREMNRLGINVNKSGNVSLRFTFNGTKGFLITPTGIPYEALEVDDIVFVPFSVDDIDQLQLKRLPSSEWLMHKAVFEAKPGVNAVVHTHSAYATALACQSLPIPAFHYMVAVAGGTDIPCAPYALFGSEALAKHCVLALAHRKACLLAHHGVVAAEASLMAALRLAHEVENLAKTYTVVRQMGEPDILSDEQMREVMERFKTYGKQK